MVIASLNKGKGRASVTGDKMDVPGGPRSRVPLFTVLLPQAGPLFIIRTLFLSRVIFTAVDLLLSGKVKLVSDGAPEKE